MNRRNPCGVLAPMVGLGAGFHDIGKATVLFDGVLEAYVAGRAGQSQPIRHEMASAMVLSSMLRLSGADGDLAFLEILSDADRLLALLKAAYRDLPGEAVRLMRLAIEAGDEGFDLNQLLPATATHPFTRAHCELVLGHHHLPYGTIEQSDRILDAGALRHAMRSMHHVKPPTNDQGEPVDPAGVARLFAPAPALFDGADASEWRLWAEEMASDAAEAARLLAVSPVDPSSLSVGAATFARTALMMADHTVSGEKTPADAALNGARVLYANTVDTRDGPRLAQPLSSHLRWIRSLAKETLPIVMSGGREMPGLEPSDLPASVLAPSPIRFAWQDRYGDAITTACEANPGTAVFGVLVAGTGTGKTQGLVKAGVAASRGRPFRFDGLLGLRSLTLQTGDQYVQRMGFPHRSVATVIGSDVVSALHALDNRARGGVARHDVAGVCVGGTPEGELPAPLRRLIACSRSPRKVTSVLSSPVLATTIDTVAPVAHATDARHLHASMRVYSAISAFDEVDSFEPEDQVALARMAFHVGLGGNSLFVASATMPPTVARVLHAAFMDGRRHRAALTGETAAAVVAWGSEFSTATEVDDGSLDFAAAHDRYIDTVVEALAEEVTRLGARRLMGVLDLDGHEDIRAAFDGIGVACAGLHADNHVVDPATGKRVSAGIVRFNNASACRAFAKHVLENGLVDGVAVRVVCYHSRFVAAVRHGIERTLKDMLSRTHGEGETDPLLRSLPVRRALTVPEDDVVVLVVTTPIIETGRDFDADWAITEPCSVHSAVQLAGRIGRHRAIRVSRSNMLMTSRKVEVITGTGTGKKWMMPGVETPVPLNRGAAGAQPFTVSDKRTAVAFPMGTWSVSVDARPSLAPGLDGWRSAKALALASMKLEWSLSGVPCGKPEDVVNRRARLLSVTGFLAEPSFHWSDCHPDMRRFRRRTLSEAVFIATGRNGDGSCRWNLQVTRDGRVVTENNSSAGICDYVPSEAAKARMLMPPEAFDPVVAVEALLRDLGDAATGQCDELAEELGAVSVNTGTEDRNAPRMHYSPVIGGHRRPITDIL